MKPTEYSNPNRPINRIEESATLPTDRVNRIGEFLKLIITCRFKPFFFHFAPNVQISDQKRQPTTERKKRESQHEEMSSGKNLMLPISDPPTDEETERLLKSEEKIFKGSAMTKRGAYAAVSYMCCAGIINYGF